MLNKYPYFTGKKDFLKMYFREQHLVVHENIEEHMSWHVESRKKMEEMLAQCLQGILRPDIAKRYGSAMVASTLFDILEGMVSNLILLGEQDPARVVLVDESTHLPEEGMRLGKVLAVSSFAIVEVPRERFAKL